LYLPGITNLVGKPEAPAGSWREPCTDLQRYFPFSPGKVVPPIADYPKFWKGLENGIEKVELICP
jgi:hypothetical protein